MAPIPNAQTTPASAPSRRATSAANASWFGIAVTGVDVTRLASAGDGLELFEAVHVKGRRLKNRRALGRVLNSGYHPPRAQMASSE